MQSLAYRALKRVRQFAVDVVREVDTEQLQEIASLKEQLRLATEVKLFSRRKLETDNAALATEVERLTIELLDHKAGPRAFELGQLRDDNTKLTAELARLKQFEDASQCIDIEPTWVCALLGDDGWSEEKRCSYDMAVEWIRMVSPPERSGIFAKSQWSAMVRTGRAR